jgi:hypothetical protein
VNRPNRGGATYSVIGLALLAAACGRGAPQRGDGQSPDTTPAGPGGSATPTDHLAPGELAEGPERAFGIALPRDLQIKRSFVDVVYARGPVSVHSLVRYFAARLDGGSAHEAIDGATFEHVRAHGKPGEELLIQISSVFDGAGVEIHTVTRPPAPNLPDEAARWRQVGLTPDGKLTDPTHLD